MRDNDTNSSKGFAFVNYASFDAADAALEAMNGQYLCNRPITISYAFKKDSKGERHGSEAERFLAYFIFIFKQNKQFLLLKMNKKNK
jgi:splicing factor 3B subunit 4